MVPGPRWGRRNRRAFRSLPVWIGLAATACGGDGGPTGPPGPELQPDTLPRLEGTWRRGPDLPYGVYRPAVAYHRGLVHLVGGATSSYGSDSGTTDELWVLDPAGGGWSRGPAYPVDGMRVALMARDDTLYGVGGQRYPGGRWDRLFRLAPRADAWERMPFGDGPTGRVSSTPLGDAHLVLDEHGSGALWAFDPDDLEWSRRASMELARANAVLVSVAGVPYAVYGQSPDIVTVSGSFIDRYEPGTDRWTRVTSTQASRRDPGVAVLDGRIHTVGGSTAHPKTVADHFVYEPATDTWYRGPDLPAPHRGLYGVAVDGELWFMGGGGAGTSGQLGREVWIFTPS